MRGEEIFVLLKSLNLQCSIICTLRAVFFLGFHICIYLSGNFISLSLSLSLQSTEKASLLQAGKQTSIMYWRLLNFWNALGYSDNLHMNFAVGGKCVCCFLLAFLLRKLAKAKRKYWWAAYPQKGEKKEFVWQMSFSKKKRIEAQSSVGRCFPAPS